LASQIDGEVRFDDLSRALYATDASVYQVVPTGVVIPKSREDVIRTVQLCGRHGCSITARGGGTSQAGQAVGAGIQLDFSKYLNRILVFNPGEQWVRVEPGIVVDELNAQLKPYGLHLPLDISTSDRATVGGMIANNSSGTRSVVYGKTLDYVMEITAALSDGSVVEFRSLNESDLAAKCDQTGLEGDCYRAVGRLTAEHATEIDRRFPKILRRVGGYNLDQFMRSSVHPFNLSRLVVGSEGTLCLVLDAKMKIVPLPPARAVAVVHFHALFDALAATPVILEHRPSAVELMDRFILESTRGKTVYGPLRGFIAGDPAAVFIVELFEESPGDLTARLDRLEAELRSRGIGYHFHRAMSAPEQAQIWKLRRAALGLSMSERGDAKAISFVEDTAVDPARLRDYIERFQQILAAHDTRAGFYAHASVGLLHVRPVVNLKTIEGVEKFQRIADEIANLVLEFGGALSGEHGDGLVRSSFQHRMYGPDLYRAFCEIKQAFDPAGIFNPGKIVHARPMIENLRFGPSYVTPDPPTALDFSDFGGLGRAAEQCSGVGECRKISAGTMCPSYMATREEMHTTRGRANALRLAMSQPNGLRLADDEVHTVLDLCLECKACKSECPTGVDMARMKAEFLHKLHQSHGVPLRARLLANPERMAKWVRRLAPFSQWFLQSRAGRWLQETMFGLSRHRPLPRVAARTFEEWHLEHTRAARIRGRGPLASKSPESPVILFRDTFTNNFEPEIGIAVTELLEAAGRPVSLVQHRCCGRPLISQGLLDEAREQAEFNVEKLFPLVETGAKILFCEPSCLSAMREDTPGLLRGDMRQRAETLARSCLLFEEYFEHEWSTRRIELKLKPGPSKILFHGHCHQKAMGLLPPAIALLSRIPQCEVVDPDAGCCGMAGSFGYLHEHFHLSRRIAELRLLPAIRSRESGTIVVAAGTSCRQQIQKFVGETAVHPVVLLRSLLHRAPV
jgi:FAD/FMN-containing dehydrogenase/Fe-S oxidoreductase